MDEPEYLGNGLVVVFANELWAAIAMQNGEDIYGEDGLEGCDSRMSQKDEWHPSNVCTLQLDIWSFLLVKKTRDVFIRRLHMS
jgi:hypothetical protein